MASNPNLRGAVPAKLTLLLACLVGAALLAGSCRSLSKPDLEERLRALGKNAPVGELSRLEFRADLGRGEEPLELVYHKAPGPIEGGGTPLVLVHGTPSTLFSWTELMHGTEEFEGLAAGRDVYAIEVIGHGIAPGGASPYGFDRCARFVAEAVRALDLPRAYIAGSSYGGEFAWRAALEAPERMAGLILFDSSGYERREQDWLSEEVVMRENGLAKIGWMLNSRDRIEAALAPHFDEIPPDRVEEFFLVCENAHNWKAMIDLARDENGDRQDELTDIQCPTLVVWGAEDIAYPLDVYGRRFAQDIPRAELVALPSTGHYPHEQRPAEVIEKLNAFFAALETSP